jgi:hypothetical protein
MVAPAGVLHSSCIHCAASASATFSFHPLLRGPLPFPPLLRGGQGGWSWHNQITRRSEGLLPPASSRRLEAVSKSDQAPGKQGGETGFEMVADPGWIRTGKAIHGVRGVRPHPPWPPLCKGGKGIGRSRRSSIARNKYTRLETVPQVRSNRTFRPARGRLFRPGHRSASLRRVEFYLGLKRVICENPEWARTYWTDFGLMARWRW